jgi:hypothetical protein
MKKAVFDPAAGKLVASVQCQPRRDGSYALRLWEPGGDELMKPSPWHGDFVSTDDDDYTLPGPLADHDGRQLQCIAVVAVPPGANAVAVMLVVTQDGQELARDSAVIPSDSPIGLATLWIQLEKGE